MGSEEQPFEWHLPPETLSRFIDPSSIPPHPSLALDLGSGYSLLHESISSLGYTVVHRIDTHPITDTDKTDSNFHDFDLSSNTRPLPVCGVDLATDKGTLDCLLCEVSPQSVANYIKNVFEMLKSGGGEKKNCERGASENLVVYEEF